MADFISNITNSGLVSESDIPFLNSVMSRIARVKNFWLVEALLILFTFVIPHFGFSAVIHGRTSSAAWIFAQAGNVNMANAFYVWFCLPLFRFLLLRWIWQLGLWCYFLYSLNRIRLHLLPIHPDGAGGLGYLEVVQQHFTPLALALSALEAASIAEEISTGSIPFETLYYFIPFVLLLNLLFFIGPLFIFSGSLWNAREPDLMNIW